ncbi:MAG: DUF6268 family outer membrane beta-barrel protein [Bacteroidota bacterium]
MIRLLFSSILMVCAYVGMAQMQPPRLGQVYLETYTQNRQRITDVPGETYRVSGMSFGMMLPVYSKTFGQRSDTLPPSRLVFTIHPSVSYGLLKISYLNQERVLMNPQLTIGSYYTFKQKNMLGINLRAMLNEDEFTIDNPKPRYAFSALYSRRVTPMFSYYGGLAYSYVFGEGQLLPLFGARFSFGKRARLNIVLPLQITYRTPLSNKLRLMVYVRPQGGINRFENRLTISDSLQKVLVFRRRSVLVGASFSFRIKNNLAVVVDPSFLFAQKISFTEDEGAGAQKFIDNDLSRGFQLRLMLVWRPWQNTLRNQQHPENQTNDDDSFLLGF